MKLINLGNGIWVNPPHVVKVTPDYINKQATTRCWVRCVDGESIHVDRSADEIVKLLHGSPWRADAE